MQMVAAPSRTVLCRAPSGAIAHSRRERAPCVACGIPRAPVLAHARCRCSRVRYFVERECVTCSVTWLPMVVVICYMCPNLLHHRWAFCAYERLARLRVARARRSGGCAVFPPGYRAAPPIRYRSCERCGTGARVFSHYAFRGTRGARSAVPGRRCPRPRAAPVRVRSPVHARAGRGTAWSVSARPPPGAAYLKPTSFYQPTTTLS